MSNKLKIVSWITAVLVSLTLTGQLQAKERGNNHRNSPIIVTQPSQVIYTNGRHRGNFILVSRNHPHFAKKRYRKKMRKIRRMRRLYSQRRIDRPATFVTREIYRY